MSDLSPMTTTTTTTTAKQQKILDPSSPLSSAAAEAEQREQSNHLRKQGESDGMRESGKELGKNECSVTTTNTKSTDDDKKKLVVLNRIAEQRMYNRRTEMASYVDEWVSVDQFVGDLVRNGLKTFQRCTSQTIYCEAIEYVICIPQRKPAPRNVMGVWSAPVGKGQTLPMDLVWLQETNEDKWMQLIDTRNCTVGHLAPYLQELYWLELQKNEENKRNDNNHINPGVLRSAMVRYGKMDCHYTLFHGKSTTAQTNRELAVKLFQKHHGWTVTFDMIQLPCHKIASDEAVYKQARRFVANAAGVFPCNVTKYDSRFIASVSAYHQDCDKERGCCHVDALGRATKRMEVSRLTIRLK